MGLEKGSDYVFFCLVLDGKKLSKVFICVNPKAEALSIS